MALRWKTFEDQVRDVAAHVFGRSCVPKRVAGRDIDGVVDLPPNQIVLIEATIDHTVSKNAGDIRVQTRSEPEGHGCGEAYG